MTPTPDVLLYLDVVEEALCFGWIDGVKKKISETELAQRLSELNKERVRRLEKLGLMRERYKAIRISRNYYKMFGQWNDNGRLGGVGDL